MKKGWLEDRVGTDAARNREGIEEQVLITSLSIWFPITQHLQRSLISTNFVTS